MKTLETLATQLQQQNIPQDKIESTLSTAMMLALVEAAHAVINQTAMPTPLYRLQYNPETSNVSLSQLQGRSQVPDPQALDMNMLDLLIAGLLREKMPLLLEGKTGVGKTFTVEQFFKTILPVENYRGLRLNANMSNVLQPYTEGRVENGLVKISLRHEEVERVAGLFIDEVNRGDTNQVLQLQDGYVRLSSGEGGELGIPIPRYVNGQWTVHKEDKRPLVVVSAQNPPATKDAKYAATKRTDAAQSNRNLQLDVPNSATDIGSAVLQLESGNGQHKKFLSHYQKLLASYLSIPETTIASIKEDWIDVYAFSTDPKKTSSPSLRSAVEFMDALLILVSPDLKSTFTHEKEISTDWNSLLRPYSVDFSYDGTIDETSTSMEKIRKIVNSFQEEIITRDIVKVKKMSDAVSLTRRIKKALNEDKPVQTYQNTPNYITLQDIACGFAIMLYDKQDKHEDDPVVLIDTALKEYTEICKLFADKVSYSWKTTTPNGQLSTAFPLDNPNMSVYHLAFGHALYQSANPGAVQRLMSTFTGKNTSVAGFIKDIGASVAELKRFSAGNEYRKPILARIIADLSTLAGFAHQYSTQLEPLLSSAKTDGERRTTFLNLYHEQRNKSSFSDIYLQRLTRVLGA